jgi:WS/DGAT/MGAT family acyltransferase
MAFLCLESAQAPMHLGALAVFQARQPPRPGRLMSVLGERAERLPRLRRSARMAWLPPGAGRWVEDRSFYVRRHLFLHQLDRGHLEELVDLAGRLMAEPLDLGRPPWQLHVVTGLAGARFAVLIKLHHAMADGLRAVELGVGLLDGFADAGPAGAPGPANGLVANLARVVASAPEMARQASDAVGIASSVASSARRGTTRSPLHTEASAKRRLALQRLDVRDVRRVRRRQGGTDNDVLLAVVTGALRDWLTNRGDRADGISLRALIPVSRRTARSARRSQGEMLSGYLCELPVHEADPLVCLHRIRTEMDRNKAAGPTRGAGALPVLASQVPAAMHRVVTPLTRRSARLLFDTVVTNVPLPELPLTLDGAKLREVYPIPPLAQGHALGVALSAYRGTVHIGLNADEDALPDLHRLADAVPASLACLSAASAAAVMP